MIVYYNSRSLERCRLHNNYVMRYTICFLHKFTKKCGTFSLLFVVYKLLTCRYCRKGLLSTCHLQRVYCALTNLICYALWISLLPIPYELNSLKFLFSTYSHTRYWCWVCTLSECIYIRKRYITTNNWIHTYWELLTEITCVVLPGGYGQEYRWHLPSGINIRFIVSPMG